MALDPGSFYDRVANLGPRNDHVLRDVATLYMALGVALALAAIGPAWRLPVCAFAAIQYLLHALNHVLDAGEAEPAWVGPADALGLAVVGLVFAGLARAAARPAEVVR